MTVRRSALLVLLAVVLAGPAMAEGVAVAGVVDGDTLVLEDGGRLRLAGIEAAKPPPGSDGAGHWPLAAAAAEALRTLAVGHRITLSDAVTDRHGILVAQAVRGDGVWLQGALLAAGHARVRTRPDARTRAAEMLELEDGARRRGMGIWATRPYAVRPAAEPDRLAADIDSFQVVEGRVRRAEKRGGTIYLDFGDDWRSDVTARVGGDAAKVFAKAGIDPLALSGRTVRLRGWVGHHYGPIVDLSHPEQMERLD